MTTRSISVVLPAFNEGENLPATVTMLSQALQNLGLTYEIIVVNDGGTDDTTSVCQRLQEGERNLRVVSHHRNRGYGAALRTGFEEARNDLVYLTDADGQFGVDHLADFLDHMETADAVMGYRSQRADPWYRVPFSRIGNWNARTVFGLIVRDINCAAKLLRRAPLTQLSLDSNGAMISTELLYRAGQHGWKIIELPVEHFPRKKGHATGANLAVLWRTLFEFTRLALREARRIPGLVGTDTPRPVA